MQRIFPITFLIIYHISQIITADEIVCVLNGKRSLHFVSDKFLSFSIDPAILLSGLNIGTSTMELAKNLNPAYIRIAGPSTGYLQFTQDETASNSQEVLKFTPAMWKVLNDWLSDTNFLPIFALGNRNLTEGKWNAKSYFPLLELSDKLNQHCFWQLDNVGRSLVDYKDELISFGHVLNIFPNSKDNWKIVGGEVSNWLKSESNDNLKTIMDDFVNITDAIVWQRSPDDISTSSQILTTTKIPVWASISKPKHPVTFESALRWAKLIGQAALLGYDVVFREPRLYEFFVETPVYWVTLLHKKLMGRSVLEVKPNQSSNGKISIFGHCTKMQNDFLRRGAATIFIVNDDITEQTIALRLSNSLKSTEVRSYILTTDFENSTNTYLNGEKISINMLNNISFTPKLRRARIQKHLAINVPPKSIAFFVLPDARIPVCINDEDDMGLLMEEIHEDQKTDFAARPHPEITPRMLEATPTLKDLYLMMEKELKVDEEYYSDVMEKPTQDLKNQKDILMQKSRGIKQNPVSKINGIKAAEITGKTLLGIKKKKEDFTKKRNELIQKLSDKSKILKEKLKSCDSEELESATSAEIEKIVTEILEEDSIKPKRKVREAKGVGRGRGAGHGTSKKKKTRIFPQNPKRVSRPRRDINMALLKEKTEGATSKDLKEDRRRYSKDELVPIVQPKYLYEKKQTTERPKLDARKILDARKKDKFHSQVEDKSRSIGLDYLDEDDYSIFDETVDDEKQFGERKNSRMNEKFPVRPTSRSKTRLAGLDKYGPKDVNAWLNREIVIDNNEDVPKTIKSLEAYLNRENPYSSLEDGLNFSFVDDYDDINYSDCVYRHKREGTQQYTAEDIKFYKQLMNSNIRHMKENMKKEKMKRLPKPGYKPINLVQKLKSKASSDLAPQPVLPPVEQGNFKENKRKNNLWFLRNRLAQQKTAEDLRIPEVSKEKIGKAYPPKRPEAVDEETKEIIKMIKDELRRRRVRSAHSFKVKYVPVVATPERARKKYVSIFPERRAWRKEDVLGLPMKKPANLIRKSENSNQKSRSTRYIHHFGNDVGNTVNGIVKEAESLLAKLDNTGISLVLPTKDEILFSNDENGVKISYKQYGTDEPRYSTCPLSTATEPVTKETSTNPTEEISTNSTEEIFIELTDSAEILGDLTEASYGIVDYVTEPLENLDDLDSNKSFEDEKMAGQNMFRSKSNIQKINKNEEGHFLDRVFKAISDFVNDMHEKIKSYLIYIN